MRFEQLVLPHLDAAFNLARWLLQRTRRTLRKRPCCVRTNSSRVSVGEMDDSLRSALEGVKNADAIALQVERLGTLHYLVLETDK